MKRILFFTILLSSFLFPVIPVQSQSLMQHTAKRTQENRQKKEIERQRLEQEKNYYEEVIDSKDEDEYEYFLSEYPKSKYAPEIRKRLAEIQLWDKAEETNTIEAYQHYLQASEFHWYDQDANSRITGIKRQKEWDIWEATKRRNTKEAFEDYLRNNPNSAYRSDAQKMIKSFEEADEWKELKRNPTIPKLQAFISKYPSGANKDAAKRLLAERLGRQYYDSNNLDGAFSEFSKLSRSEISSENRHAYDEAMTYHEFSELSSSSLVYQLEKFKNEHPGSRYEVQVNNYLAVAKANKFNYSSSDANYNLALSLASDSATRDYVKQKIKANKESIRFRKKMERSAARKANGGLINLGIKYLDMGFDLSSAPSRLYYDFGLSCRIGNYADRVQLNIGLIGEVEFLNKEKAETRSYYGYGYNDPEYDPFKNTKGEFHLAASGQLKINLCRLGDSCWWFGMAQYDYKFVHKNSCPSDYRAGLGFGWKYMDFTLYYRSDLGTTKYINSKAPYYIGFDFAAFIPL